jgi:UPF0755 protein
MKRWLLRLVGLLLVLSVAAGGAGYAAYSNFREAPLNVPDDGVVVEVERGSSLTRIVDGFARANLSDARPEFWRVLAWQLGGADRLHAGEYQVTPGMRPGDLLALLRRGEVIQHRFTLVDGWSLRDLRAALAAEPLLEHDLARVDDRDLMTKLGRSGLPEGRFLPETYAFVKRDPESAVLRRAAEAMDKALALAWKDRDTDLPLKSPEEALILASIVEKETGRAEERPQIAGVFARRLKIGMRLQTDPTVIYGLGAAFDGNLTRAHLEADTPFNTYTRAGLPPTPIAMPGMAALRAATKPAPGSALYFVARGDGSHQFSATLAEHNAAVAKFQLRRR